MRNVLDFFSGIRYYLLGNHERNKQKYKIDKTEFKMKVLDQDIRHKILQSLMITITFITVVYVLCRYNIINYLPCRGVASAVGARVRKFLGAPLLQGP